MNDLGGGGGSFFCILHHTSGKVIHPKVDINFLKKEIKGFPGIIIRTGREVTVPGRG